MVFWFAFLPLLFFPEQEKIRIDKLCAYLRWFAYLTTIATVLQIVLFVAVGRLPALGYEDSPFIRFGGLWDDPNGFAIFLSFLLPFIYFSSMGRVTKAVLLVINLAALAVTQSFTGIAAFLGSVVAVLAWLLLTSMPKSLCNKLRSFVLLIGSGGLVAAGALWYVLQMLGIDVIATAIWYLEHKRGSVSEHNISLDEFLRSGLSQWLGFDPGFVGESGYINLILNFGVINTFAYALLLVAIFVRSLVLLKKYHAEPNSELFFGVSFFMAAFLLAMLNLPLDEVFPINLLFVIFAMLVVHADRLATRAEVTSRVGDRLQLAVGGNTKLVSG